MRIDSRSRGGEVRPELVGRVYDPSGASREKSGAGGATHGHAGMMYGRREIAEMDGFFMLSNKKCTPNEVLVAMVVGQAAGNGGGVVKLSDDDDNDDEDDDEGDDEEEEEIINNTSR